MTVGMHGSTFGGNPLAMAVAIAAFDEISRVETLDAVNRRSGELRAGLETIAGRYPRVVREIRGRGLLIGMQLAVFNKDFISLARAQNLLVTGGADNVVRLLPALTITAQEVSEVLIRFERTCEAASERLVADTAETAT